MSRDSQVFLASLRKRGWVQSPDGSWSPGKGVRVLGPMEAHRPQPAAVRSLDKGAPEPEGRGRGMAVHITCLALRRRLLDNHDAVAYSMKPLTDSIAKTLGVDDADPRLTWEYAQQQTRGEEGVIVKLAFYRA